MPQKKKALLNKKIVILDGRDIFVCLNYNK